MEAREAFVDQVRDVLAHLHDAPHLQSHPLMERFGFGEQFSPARRIRLLRSLVTDAIEEMAPGSAFPFRSLPSRAYDVLNLRYIEGLTVHEVARELAVSERQAHRDLRKAEHGLAALLWNRRQASRTEERDEVSLQAVLAEAKRLTGTREDVRLKTLLESAVEAVTPLAERRQVRIRTSLPPTPLSARTLRTLLRQILIGVLSQAIQQADLAGEVTVLAQRERAHIRVTVSYTDSVGDTDGWGATFGTPRQLLELLGERWEARTRLDGTRRLSFTVGCKYEATVLVVDDNEGLIELFRSYLEGEGYRVLGAYDGETGVALAEQCRPDAIVLDIMMPRQDGWEILQMLQHRQHTQDIPVVICSVINDPQLAASLGAAEILKKPVTQEDVLTALENSFRRIRPLPNPGEPASSR